MSNYGLYSSRVTFHACHCCAMGCFLSGFSHVLPVFVPDVARGFFCTVGTGGVMGENKELKRDQIFHLHLQRAGNLKQQSDVGQVDAALNPANPAK